MTNTDTKSLTASKQQPAARLNGVPDHADRYLADRPFPLVTPANYPRSHAQRVAHLQDVSSWWLELAQRYLDLAAAANKAHDDAGTVEAIEDARRAYAVGRSALPSRAAKA